MQWRNPLPLASAGILAAGLLLVWPAPAPAAKFNKTLDLGSAAPAFRGLAGVDGRTHGLDEYRDARVVVLCVLCNQCPCVQAYEQRLIEMQRDFSERGVRFVAVNPNSSEANRLERMKARAEERGFNFPYLHDPEQTVPKAYGARITPTVFVLDRERKVAYMGAIDDSRDPDRVEHRYLRDALEAVVAGRRPTTGESRPVGCEIEDRE